MNISKIKKDLEGQKDFPPVHKWNPELCEGQEFFIDREGNWFHNNSPIKNKKLINLFSTVIRKDDDNYFLVTPVEKVPVKVELAPYKIIDFAITNNNIKLVTNMDYEFVLNELNTTRLINLTGRPGGRGVGGQEGAGIPPPPFSFFLLFSSFPPFYPAKTIIY